MKTIRIGVMGCGPRGMQMARITKLIPESFTLTCMSDLDETRLAEAQSAFPEIKLFRSSDELLDSGLADAVITEIPPSVHTEYVAKALDRDIHVLGEIPAVHTIEEGEFLWDKVNSAKALYMAGSNPNYREKTRFLHKLNREGRIGKIAYIETEYMHTMINSRDWRKEYESCRYCTHSLGPVLSLIGSEFKTVCCMSTLDRLGNGNTHNAMSALLRTDDNIVVRLLVAFGVPYFGPAHTTRIFCEKGVLELYNEKARYWLPENTDLSLSGHKYEETPLTPVGTARPADLKIIDEDLFLKAHCGHNGSDIFMMKDFADAIVNHKPSPIGIREALKMTLPGIYAAESAREGGALKTIRYPWSK